MLITPILNEVKPFTANQSYDFIFNVYGGDQVVKNRLIIEKVTNGQIVYDNYVESFQFKHTLPSNTLINGVKYRAKLKTYNNLNQESQYSDSILFYCFSLPIVSIININDSIVKNSIYNFIGSYSQLENELSQSYRFYLYDYNEVLLTSSKEIFDTDFRYTFENLNDNGHYFIELKVFTVNGMIASSGLIPFDVDYIKPQFHTSVILENVTEQGSIKINGHILNIEGQVGSGTISYENNDWLNAKNGSVYFDTNHGFNLNGDFTFKIFIKDLVEDKVFLTLYSENGVIIKLVFYKQKIHCFKELNGYILSHYTSNDINIHNNEDIVFIFMQSQNNRIFLKSEIM